MEVAAPLLGLAEAPVPAGAAAFWLRAADGTRLRAALFRPEGPARGSVVFSPGRSEPIEKYFEVVEALQARGFAVLVHDWRGQGLSDRFLADPMKDHARGWRRFLDDYDRLLAGFGDRLPGPWLACGHSMGAGLTVLALAEGETRFAGAIVSAPMLGLRTEGWPQGVALAWAVAKGVFGQAGAYVHRRPADPLAGTFETNVLTHDRCRWTRSRTQLEAYPELRLGGITWGWLVFALALCQRLARLGGARRIAVPLTIVAAGDDRLCLNGAAKAVAAQAVQGRYVEIAGAFHELLMETDRLQATFWAEFDALADRVAPR